MNTNERLYRVRVREHVIAEYLVRAESPEQAGDFLGCGLTPESRVELETPDWETERVALVDEQVGNEA